MLQFRRGLTRALLLQVVHIFFSLPHAIAASSSTAVANETSSFNVTSPSSTMSRSNTSSTSVATPTPSPSKPFQPPGSFPQVYGNMSSGGFDTEWQDCLSFSVSDNPGRFLTVLRDRLPRHRWSPEHYFPTSEKFRRKYPS